MGRNTEIENSGYIITVIWYKSIFLCCSISLYIKTQIFIYTIITNINGIVINDNATWIEIILAINFVSPTNWRAKAKEDTAVGTEANITATIISSWLSFR